MSDTVTQTIGGLTIRSLASDSEIGSAFALMHELRPHLIETSFISDIRAQMAQGYLLAGGYDESDRLVTLAGYRYARTLFRGPHLFVDDLVTSSAAQGKGFGTAMLAWLGQRAAERGLADVWLDSRSSARTFYEQVGFEMKSAIPCRMAARDLATVLKDRNTNHTNKDTNLHEEKS